MASTYSPALRIELIATGEQSGTWGVTTNTNLGTLIEQAITGYLSVAQGDVANLTLSTANGATDQARNAVVNVTGALTAARNVVVPTANKVYIVRNATTGGFAITVKTSGGTGVSVPNGDVRLVYCDGTNVVTAQPVTILDSVFRIQDNSDPTKQVAFELSSITTATTRTLTIPDSDLTIVGTTTTQTLTNKTLTAPVIATISNSGTLTLPTGSDTLVGRATTDTLTNKTLGTGTLALSSGVSIGDATTGLAALYLGATGIIRFGNDFEIAYSSAGGGSVSMFGAGAGLNYDSQAQWGTLSTTGATIGVDIFASSTPLYRSSTTSTGIVQNFRFYNPNGLVGSIHTNGSATAYNTSSDQTKKIDDGEMPVETAEQILSLIVVHNFRWKADNKDDHGVFAQELYEVYPSAVAPGGWFLPNGTPASEGDDGTEYIPWSVDYSKLITPLMRVTQGLMQRVAALEMAGAT